MPPKKKRAAGEGTVRKRKDGLWEARLPVPGREPRSFYSKSQAEAMRKRDEARAALLSGMSFDADDLTVAGYLARWLEGSARPGVAASTYRRYEQDVRRHLAPAIGGVPLRKLTAAHVELLKHELLSAKHLKPSTVRQCLVTLSVALNRAVKWELIKKNPARAVQRPKVTAPDYRCLTEAEAGALVRHVRGEAPRYEALYHLALKYGLREGELAALTWDDLDAQKRTLAVRAEIVKTGEGRTLKLAWATVEALAHHRRLQLEEKLAAGSAWEDRGLIFPDGRGGRQKGWNMLAALRRHLGNAGLPKIRFHDLRDTAATLMLEDGWPVHRVARILGHKDPAMTLRRYAHVLAEMEDAGAERLDRWAF